MTQASPGETVELAKVRLRPYKPGKYGKGTIPDPEHPEAQTWRVKAWDGNPHHDDVGEALGIDRPMVTFHIDRACRFYFHHSGQGHLKPSDPAGLARAVTAQHPELRWGRQSAEEHERTARQLALGGRPLRAFEQGAHLHVLDWTHQTARQRFQAAGAVQIKAASKAVVSVFGNSATNPTAVGSPRLPALEAAITMELRKLYAVGHATVRSELDHQRHGRALPIGLSKAPEPPGLRTAATAAKRCGTCHMFDQGACWGYGNHPVEPDEVCDSWAKETVRTLATAPALSDPGRLRARAALIASDVAHQVSQAIARARLHGITDRKQLRRIGRAAGHGALGQNASLHAGAAIAAGRHDAATNGSTQVIGARYTSVLDKATCGPCADADTGELIAIGDPAWVPTPNPACLGGGRCRCIHVYQLATETRPARPPARPPIERPAYAAVGVGGS